MVFPFSVWLVAEADDADDGGGVTLVDAGLSFLARGILRAIEGTDAGPLRRILSTHGRPDHIGAIAAIRRERPVPVFAHRVEIPYLEGRQPYPGRRIATTGVDQGVVQALREDEAGALVVDRPRPRSLEVAHGGRVLGPASQLDAYLAADRRPRTTLDPTAQA